MQDIDWYRWAHRNAQASVNGQCSRQDSELYFKTTGASGGDFNAMEITCDSCDAGSSLVGLTDGPYLFGCYGRQPWEPKHSSRTCRAVARVFPRAASNVYYAQQRSALDIRVAAVNSGTQQLLALRKWLKGNPLLGTLRGMCGVLGGNVPEELYKGLAQEAVRVWGVSEQLALETIADAIHKSDDDLQGGNGSMRASEQSQHAILQTEWPHLARRTGVTSPTFRSSIAAIDAVWPPSYRKIIEQVTLIERLREVRALIGFRRVKPEVSSPIVRVDLGKGIDWLPGVEAFGEGIFLKFAEEALEAWEQGIQAAFARRSEELREACARWGRTPESIHASARFVALHTISHGLIRRLAFDAGYSSASIRERIYCDIRPNAAAGILLYTADGDSEGSLGGLVRQGEPARLLTSLERTIADLSWCSSDPVCSELEGQGVDGLNGAACHACCLVSETSCGYNNSLLDRRLLVGGGSFVGLLEGIV